MTPEDEKITAVAWMAHHPIETMDEVVPGIVEAARILLPSAKYYMLSVLLSELHVAMKRAKERDG